MELYGFLTSAPNATVLKARVEFLCKGREIGESLTHSMLLCILDALETKDGDFTKDIVAINEEIKIQEDMRSINERNAAYGIHSIPATTRPPTKILISASSRAAPSKFTLTKEIKDSAGRVWTWAPYTAEVWRGSYK